MNYHDLREAVRGEPLPAAFVDVDAFDRNAARVEAIVGAAGPRVRLATKSLRVPDLIMRLLKRGPAYRGLMCFAAREAAFLSEQGFDDLLVAYPISQERDARLLRGLVDADRSVSVVLDSDEGIALLARAMKGSAVALDVVIELDVSPRALGGLELGALRSPLREPRQVLALVERLSGVPELRFKGLMAYESLAAGVGDRNPFKRTNAIVSLLRRSAQRTARARREETATLLKERGFGCELVNGGGTGSLPECACEPGLTEVAAGSAFYGPHLFDYYSNVRFEPAAFFALPVTRRPGGCVVTCQSGGFAASGAPGWDRVPRPWLPDGSRLTKQEACGEAQTPVRLPPGANLELGDPVFLRHSKAGELAEHFNEVVLLSGGKIAGRAKTYRGLGQDFH